MGPPSHLLARGKTGDELDALRARRRLTGPRDGPPPSCCTYDQVYRSIIDLLSATSRTDPALSRAYVEELEVSSCRD